MDFRTFSKLEKLFIDDRYDLSDAIALYTDRPRYLLFKYKHRSNHRTISDLFNNYMGSLKSAGLTLVDIAKALRMYGYSNLYTKLKEAFTLNDSDVDAHPRYVAGSLINPYEIGLLATANQIKDYWQNVADVLKLKAFNVKRLKEEEPGLTDFDMAYTLLSYYGVVDDELKQILETVSKEKPVVTNSSNKLCKKCNKKQYETVLVPCGHLAYCKECSRTYAICPICNKEVIMHVDLIEV